MIIAIVQLQCETTISIIMFYELIASYYGDTELIDQESLFRISISCAHQTE